MKTNPRIEKLVLILEKDPNDSFTRYALALEFKSLNDYQTAINLLTELIERDSKYVAAYHQLGQIYVYLNRTDLAKKTYRKGIEVAELVGEKKPKQEMEEELEEIEDEW
ncbi:MAG: tetratricopeptide repeat protein [Bacteroidetes bacterium]|nr:tetratricopeptide repeat protein [Bacteroidota bacterium]